MNEKKDASFPLKVMEEKYAFSHTSSKRDNIKCGKLLLLLASGIGLKRDQKKEQHLNDDELQMKTNFIF